MATVFEDDFTYADTTSLPSPWQEDASGSGDVSIVSNELESYVADSFNASTLAWPESGSTYESTDFDVTVKVRVDGAASSLVIAGILARVPDTSGAFDGYGMLINNRASVPLFEVVRIDSDVNTTLGSDSGEYLVDDTDYFLRFQGIGSNLKAKYWEASGSEPGTWNIEVTDSTHTAAGSAILYASRQSGDNTVYWDDFTYTDGSTTTTETGTGTGSVTFSGSAAGEVPAGTTQSVAVEGFDWATSGADDTLTLTNDVGDLDNAFVRVTSAGTRSGGSGPTGSTSNQGPNNMLAVELTATDTLTARRSSTTTEQKVFGEVWRYLGPSGGANEFISRGVYAISLGTGTSASTAVTGLADRNKAVPFLVGVVTDQSSRSEFNRATIDVYIDGSGNVVAQRGEGGSALTAYVQVVEFVGANWSVGHGVSASHDSVVETVTLNTDSTGTGGSTFDVGDWSTALIIAATMEGDTNETGLADTLANVEPGASTTTVNFDIDTADEDAANDGEAHFHVIQHDDLSVFREVITSISETNGGANNSIGFPTGTPTDRNLDQLSVGEWYVSTSGTGTAHLRGALGAVITDATGTVEHWVHRSGNNVRVTWAVADLTGITDTASGAETGTGTGTVTFSGSATGLRTAQATAAGTATFTGSASGERTREGTGTGTVTFSGSATGDQIANLDGTGSGNVAFTGTAAGERTREGTGVGAVEFTGTAAGERTREGSGSGSVTFTGTATGTAEGNLTGQGAGTVTFGGTAQGLHTGVGQASGTVTFAGTAEGQRTASRGAAGTVEFTGTATGARTREGSGSGAVAFTGTSTGQRTTSTTGAGSVEFTATATGQATGEGEGTGSGSVVFAGTATGQRTANAQAVGTVEFATTATGQRTAITGGVGTVQWTASATGKRTAQGVVTAAIVTFTGAAEAVRTALATAQGAVEFTATAAGGVVGGSGTHQEGGVALDQNEGGIAGFGADGMLVAGRQSGTTSIGGNG